MTDNAVAKLAAAYSPEKRDSLQKKGQAFKNGNGESSYPIPDVAHLKAAIQGFGRAKPEDKDRLKRYIIKRAKALGAEDLIPDGWRGGDTSSTSADGEDSALVNLARLSGPALGKLEQKLELSADTARVSTVHSPLGKPGGPGLFKTKGLQLPAYIQNIAKALMRKRGFTESRAIATAISRVKVWAAGGGGVSPEVKAAAAKAVAEWEAAKARARATPNKR